MLCLSPGSGPLFGQLRIITHTCRLRNELSQTGEAVNLHYGHNSSTQKVVLGFCQLNCHQKLRW